MNTMAANMANMNPAMGGPVGGPMPMMNNGAVAPQVGPRHLQDRTLLNTYIYEYFMRYGMYDCARAILNEDNQIKVLKDGNGRSDNGLGDEHMDADSKDGQDQKRPQDLPAPNVPTPVPDSCFLFEWFSLFWDMFNSQKGKGSNGQINQYVQHTQNQSRMRQEQQQNMLRQIRPEFAQQQAQYQQQQMMRGMQNGGMNMNMKPNPLQRTAMANSQNPQTMHLIQQSKAAANQIQMQRDPSDMDGNRVRPASPGSAENAPSPSKRQRLENGPFNPNQGVMMTNGRPAQGMPGQQQVGNRPTQDSARTLFFDNSINPTSLNPDQFQAFVSPNPNAAKSIATYAANLQQHHGSQMANKPMPNPGGPQTQGSPMNQQAPDGAALGQFYNNPDMAPGNMRAGGPGNGQGQSNGALQDYQMQLMLLEQQNKKRLMMARQEQDMSGGGMREGGPSGPGGPGGPGVPPGPNAQNFQGTSPPGGRSGASPNPSEQMKRANQMNNPANMGSPLPDGAQSRSSPGAINFIGNNLDPNGAPNFFKAGGNVDGMNMMNAAQMNGMRPPSSHPAQPFNGQMNPQQQQQMMAARQQAQQQAQAHAQAGPGMQWPPTGPNGQMAGQGPQPQVQGTSQQRSMPPPSAPAATANNANSRNATSSPQTSTAAPPTPSTANKAAPKKKESKSAKSKAATQKKSNANLNTGATPAAEAEPQQETPAPPTPITPTVNAGNFAKNQTLPAQVVANGQPTGPAQAPQPAPVPAQQHPDSGAGNFMDPTTMDFQMDFANPLNSSDVLNDFDFDSFLHESNGEESFDFNAGAFMEGGEIGAD